MMSFFDRFVDTRAKRRYAVQIIAILMVMYMVFTYARLASHLIALETYEDLFALLQISYSKQTYIARVIISCMALPEITFLAVLKSVCISLRFFDVLTLFSFIALACYTSCKKRRVFRLALFIWGLAIVLSGAFALPGLQANTLQVALTQITYIGITFMIGGIGVIVILLYMLSRVTIQYREALRYDAIELM